LVDHQREKVVELSGVNEEVKGSKYVENQRRVLAMKSIVINSDYSKGNCSERVDLGGKINERRVKVHDYAEGVVVGSSSYRDVV
jgi:hypothetical protein